MSVILYEGTPWCAPQYLTVLVREYAVSLLKELGLYSIDKTEFIKWAMESVELQNGHLNENIVCKLVYFWTKLMDPDEQFLTPLVWVSVQRSRINTLNTSCNSWKIQLFGCYFRHRTKGSFLKLIVTMKVFNQNISCFGHFLPM